MNLIFTLLAAASIVSSPKPEKSGPNFKEWDGAPYIQSMYGEKDSRSKRYSLKLEKVKEMTTKFGQVPVYHLRANGIPEGRKFQIGHRSAEGKVITVFDGVYLGGGQILRKNDVLMAETSDIISIGHVIRGEPSEFLLIDPTDNTTDSAFYLPYSIEDAVADDGTKITMQHVSNNPPLYLFGVQNLTPGESIDVVTDSNGKIFVSSFIVPKSGKFVSLESPAEDGRGKGKGIFEVRNKRGSLSVNYCWSNKKEDLSKLPPTLVIFTVDHDPEGDDRRYAERVYKNEILPAWVKNEKK